MNPTRYYIVFDNDSLKALAAVRAANPRAAIGRYAGSSYNASVATQEDMLLVGRMGVPVMDLGEAEGQSDITEGA